VGLLGYFILIVLKIDSKLITSWYLFLLSFIISLNKYKTGILKKNKILIFVVIF
jgi:hypothetical protein